MKKDFTPFISFDDKSTSFVYGCEYGRLLEKMERGDSIVSNNGLPIRIENKGTIIRTCEKLGYVYTFGVEDDGWISFMATKKITTDN